MANSDDWKLKPTTLNFFKDNIDCMLFIDETGTPSLKNYNTNNCWFSVTGVLINAESGQSIIENFMKLKRKYWKDALFNNKRVLFHSREFRKKLGPFNPKIINNEALQKDFFSFIENSNFNIFSSAINKDYLTTNYSSPYAVYWYSLLFIIERFALYLENNNKKGIIVLEARGKKEDEGLLKSITPILENGSKYVSAESCSRIQGLYFNKKRTNNYQQSYPYLEIADMVGYAIHRKACKNFESELYDIIEPKIYHYPKINGFGLKIFDRK